MITYREIISNIQGTLNAVAKDTFIPRRLIFSILKLNIRDFISKKLNDKSLFREVNLFDWIECIEMKNDNAPKCDVFELRSCKEVMKSKKPLPNLIWSRFGSSIQLVTNIDHSKEYKIISEKQYMQYSKRKGFEKFKGKYAILGSDNHLYIPDSAVEIVNVLLFSLDDDRAKISTCGSYDECQSPLDAEVTVPDKILSPAIDMTLQKLAMRLQIPRDENPDTNSNSK